MANPIYGRKFPRRVEEANRFVGGIADFPKEGIASSYAFGRGIDIRSDPRAITLLPAPVKESGSLITSLPKWGERVQGRLATNTLSTNLVTNGSFEVDTTGWNLDADYTRSSADSYDGAFSVKQVSVNSFANFYSNSIAVEANSNYTLTFYNKVSAAGLAPLMEINTTGAFNSTTNVLGVQQIMTDTAGQWVKRTFTFQTGAATTVYIRFFNNNQAVTAYYDNFSLIKGSNAQTFVYDEGGNIYSRSALGSYSLQHTMPVSHGNGMKYYGEDDFLYATTDKTIGRYGPISGSTPQWTDDFLAAFGGVPSNTNSIALIAGSSQYLTAADSASLSDTGDITLESYNKFTSLPAVGNSMTLIGKWDESGALRSYKMDIYGISGYFGTGADGSQTISTNTTDAPIDSAASGTMSTNIINATNGSFVSGQVIMVHQTRGSGSGTWQRMTVQSYSTGQITTVENLNLTYNSSGNNRAQVLVMKQYSDVTVQSGKTWTAKAWNGTVGGILAFLCSGTFNNSGHVSADACGFRGGQGQISSSVGTHGFQGEGTGGPGDFASVPNGNGGAGAIQENSNSLSRYGGAGGSNYTAGGFGTNGQGFTGSTIAPGSTTSAADATIMTFGGAGASGVGDNNAPGDYGGNGGGIIAIFATTYINTGTITSAGAQGTFQGGGNQATNSGGGAGGYILIRSQNVTDGSNLCVAGGGAATQSAPINHVSVGPGGVGGSGVIHVDYLSSVTLTSTTPVFTAQDNTLVTTLSWQLRFGVSNDGTAFEYLTKNITIAINQWYRFAISWRASTSLATFYLNGTNQGTVTGTKTAIHDNTSLLYVGANKGASAVQNFMDGLVDDVRIWNVIRSDSQILSAKDIELAGTETGLVGYWKLNASLSDTTSNANNLTNHATALYSTTVPFSNASARQDIDLSNVTAANTYTPPVSIDEGSTGRLSIVPTKDPQKSVDFDVSTVGSGSITVTVHDGLNNVIAQQTIANASLVTGFNEFIFSNPWRPVLGATYHIHVTSTVANSAIHVGTVSDLRTASYHTYYQFLITDTAWHPVIDMLNFIAIGNERYVAVYDASTYNPHRLKLPAGHRVRCFAKWKGYLAIGCTFGNQISDVDYGRVFLWDGSAQTYNDFFDVPEGGINAMLGSKGQLHIFAGYKGDHLIYTGADGADKIRRLPKVSTGQSTEIYPGAMAMWQALLRIGVSGSSDSTTLERGTYTYGAITKAYPDVYTYDYPISTGNRASTSVRIGMIIPVEKKLLVGWQDNISCGVDVIDPAGLPQASGTLELLISDTGVVWKEKTTTVLRSDFLPLLTGENIDIKYKIDRETNWHNEGISAQLVGDKNIRLPMPADSRHHEIQIAADITQTNGTTPSLIELAFEEDFLLTEEYK